MLLAASASRTDEGFFSGLNPVDDAATLTVMKLALVPPLGLILATLGFASSANGADGLPKFDFTSTEQVQLWQAANDVGLLRATPEGMIIPITGADPFINGPKFDLPAKPMWLVMRIKSPAEGRLEVFYYRDNARAGQSASASVPAGGFSEVRVALPAMGPGWHVRIDPPGTSGEVIIASAAFEPREPFSLPTWPKPVLTHIDDAKQAAGVVTSGPLQLLHGGKLFGGFQLNVIGEKMAVGLSPTTIGYTQDGQPKWQELSATPKIEKQRDAGFTEIITLNDAEEITWTFRRTFSPGKIPSTIDVVTEVAVSQDRQAAFLPLMMLLPGAGSFGDHKSQAIFPGLEYLADEPSSSEADIVGPQSKRLVPDMLKLTFPMMAINAKERYVGLVWDFQPDIAAIFDSPDRRFASGGHAMGLIFPGSNGTDRVEGSLLPERAVTLSSKNPLILRATLIGGPGKSLAPAIQKYVEMRGLPPLPDTGKTLKDYVAHAAGGWMDSGIREGDRFRHALGGDNFKPHPAADASVWMRWLAAHTDDAALKERLTATAAGSIKSVATEQLNFSGVSHIRYPVAALLTGDANAVESNAKTAENAVRGEIARFEPDGTLKYHRAPGTPDYGKTHNEPDANGLTASVVGMILQQAAFSGDPKLIAEGIRLLRAMDKFDNGVPRGAQTWEVPLHTPDILASAFLVKAYVLGYELTGDDHFLERAKYWAWTGVPFVYLRNPTAQPIGPYATIAVFGATNWEAPIWFGKPVQWCGLVYADAIANLALHDRNAPWDQLSKGIAASGVQQSWPGSFKSQQGLLPDSLDLRSQRRDGPDINPGTLQSVALRLYDQPNVYSFHRFPKFGAIVHAAGTISVKEETPEMVRFTVEPWSPAQSCVLIAGLARNVTIGDSADAPLVGGRRVVTIKGPKEFIVRASVLEDRKPAR